MAGENVSRERTIMFVERVVSRAVVPVGKVVKRAVLPVERASDIL